MSDAASAPLTPEQQQIRDDLAGLQKNACWCDGDLIVCESCRAINAALRMLDSQALALTQQQQEIERLTLVIHDCADRLALAGREHAAITAERDSLKRELIDIGNWRTMRRRSTPHE